MVTTSDWINALGLRPEPWAPGAAGLWTDAHIAAGMLKAHLDPETDAASRGPEIIDKSVRWLVAALGLHRGKAVLDLGCGPGLYSRRLAAAGLAVTGVDISESSITLARTHDDLTDYRVQDYLDLKDMEAFDACLLIYGDFCVLNDAQRDRLLATVHRALKRGGLFAFDVTTRRHRAKAMRPRTWAAFPEGGFWRAGAHVVLNETLDYPERDLAVDRYAVIEPGGAVTVYHNWFHDYDEASIRAVLDANDFEVVSVHADLEGHEVSGEDEWLGIVARCRDR
jgi:SAM-dependent methyltransferase